MSYPTLPFPAHTLTAPAGFTPRTLNDLVVLHQYNLLVLADSERESDISLESRVAHADLRARHQTFSATLLEEISIMGTVEPRRFQN